MLFAVSTENLKNLKIHAFWKKKVLSVIFSKCNNKDTKVFKEEESLEILKIIGLIENI